MNSYNELVADFLSAKPKDVQGLNNSSYMFYRQELYLKVYSLFKWNNLPDTWDIDYLNDNLWRNGYLCVVDYSGSTYALVGGMFGINAYNKPTEVNIGNPVLGSFTRKIGDKAEILYFNYVNGKFASIEPLIKRYALMLAQCDGSINSSLMNSRVAHVFYAKTDSEYKTYQKMYDKVSSGQPMVVLKKGNEAMLENTSNEFMNLKSTYIANDIMLTKQSIYHEFLTEIGINNANNDKRERLNADEVNSNNNDIKALVSLWKDNLERSIERINNTFGTNISIEYNDEVVKLDTEKEVQEYELD